MEFPPELENFIIESVGLDKGGTGFNDRLRRLRSDLQALSGGFAGSVPSESAHADAYFAYNFPMNFMKSFHVGAKLKAVLPAAFKGRGEISILDIGCGEGAGMYGFYYAMSGTGNSAGSRRRFRLTGVDASNTMTERAAALGSTVSKVRSGCAVGLRRLDINAGLLRTLNDGAERYDAVLFSNSLIEIITGKMLPRSFIDDVLSLLTGQGLLIVIEPALKEYTRRLMGLRNILACDVHCRIVLPCGHDAECPLLAIEDEEEWCHFSVPWQPPGYLRRLNQGLNREVDMLKFSYLVLFREEKQGRDDEVSGFTVISRLIREKGKCKAFICAPSGRIEVYRLDKDKSRSNQAFDSIISSDTVVIGDQVVKRPGLWRIEKTTSVKVL